MLETAVKNMLIYRTFNKKVEIRRLKYVTISILIKYWRTRD